MLTLTPVRLGRHEIAQIRHVPKLFWQFVGSKAMIEAVIAKFHKEKYLYGLGSKDAAVKYSIIKNDIVLAATDDLPERILTQTTISHPMLYANWAMGRFVMLSQEDGMPEGFFGRLSNNLTMGVMKEWTAKLWELGQAEYMTKDECPVTPIVTMTNAKGIIAWDIQTRGEYEYVWIQIIKKARGG